MLWIGCRSGLHWTHTKKRLDFCTVTQDGWDEGCLRPFGLPTPDQADEIRDILGIRVELTPHGMLQLGRYSVLMGNGAGAPRMHSMMPSLLGPLYPHLLPTVDARCRSAALCRFCCKSRLPLVANSDCVAGPHGGMGVLP